MKEVFQTIIDSERGNCMQAVIASLLEVELDGVPNFIEYDKWWYSLTIAVMDHYGYSINKRLYNENIGDGNIREQDSFKDLKNHEGVNGFFYAVVKSPMFHETGGTHAIIIDKDFNVVHDPNPEYKDLESYPYADEYGYNGIIEVWVFNRPVPMVFKQDNDSHWYLIPRKKELAFDRWSEMDPESEEFNNWSGTNFNDYRCEYPGHYVINNLEEKG